PHFTPPYAKRYRMRAKPPRGRALYRHTLQPSNDTTTTQQRHNDNATETTQQITLKEDPLVFTELMPLLVERTVLITVARESDTTIRVNVCPKRSSEGENAALSTPL